ncbi:hypothetical protein CKAH01_10153 [Colletotrichum kahawae]|uniref:Uncharacterized protein n=1 Tax=Colletotrichum kahawae TaxID=34407 RepID=A0AAD9XXK7_COLKA|nr:hypothetical protein CKAH01_10153 [Colletotrichum kahawae]
MNLMKLIDSDRDMTLEEADLALAEAKLASYSLFSMECYRLEGLAGSALWGRAYTDFDGVYRHNAARSCSTRAPAASMMLVATGNVVSIVVIHVIESGQLPPRAQAQLLSPWSRLHIEEPSHSNLRLSRGLLSPLLSILPSPLSVAKMEPLLGPVSAQFRARANVT